VSGTVVAALVRLWAAIASAALAHAGAPGLAAIRGESLSAHIRFLADDLLEGRAPGTNGHALAARYLAAQLQAVGAEPAGDGGGWFQPVPFLAMRPDLSRCALTIAAGGPDARFVTGEDVLISPSPARPDSTVEGELVFSGRGIVAPAYRYDDVAPDLKGKIAVVLYGAPRSERDDFFPSAASAVYADGIRKARLLAARGAVAVISVATPESLHIYPWDERVRDARSFESLAWLESEGGAPGSGTPVPAANLRPEAFERLLRVAGRKETLAELLKRSNAGTLRPFPLGVRATLTTAASVRPLVSENVVGVLRGSDPVRSKEYVAVSAHLDHLGRGPEVAGDGIYNGATDDASGIASLIEIAKAFAALPKRPPRSILFVAVTAEEKGLLGSDYFARHPAVPVSAIVANVNSDGPTGWWRPHDVVALGAEHSSLEADASNAAAALGLKLSPDPDPEQVYFIRSDQYSFVKVGIPSAIPGVGYLDASGGQSANRATMEKWLAKHYHQPSDEWDPKLDYEDMAIEVRYYFLTALSVALDPARPTWKPGDVFGTLFTPAK
jgi:hypothetical protein